MCDICWSRNVFSERLKTAIDVDCRIGLGSEFQSLRASASQFDWLHRNWDGWCSVSSCATDISLGIQVVFRTGVDQYNSCAVNKPQ